MFCSELLTSFHVSFILCGTFLNAEKVSKQLLGLDGHLGALPHRNFFDFMAFGDPSI